MRKEFAAPLILYLSHNMAAFAPDESKLLIEIGEIPKGKLGVQAGVPFLIQYDNGKGTAARISPADLEAEVTAPDGVKLQSKINGAANSYRVLFTPHMKGIYHVDVTLRNKWQRRINATIYGATSLNSYLEGINRVPRGVYHLRLITVDEDNHQLGAGGDSKFEFLLNAPEGSYQDFKIKDNKDGTYTLEVCLLLAATEYEFSALYHGQNISNSPFKIQTMSG